MTSLSQWSDIILGSPPPGMRIHPQDIVANGTSVFIEGRGAGTIASSEQRQDQHGKPITVHSIRYPDGTVKTCNYSFIRII